MGAQLWSRRASPASRLVAEVVRIGLSDRRELGDASSQLRFERWNGEVLSCPGRDDLNHELSKHLVVPIQLHLAVGVVAKLVPAVEPRSPAASVTERLFGFVLGKFECHRR